MRRNALEVINTTRQQRNQAQSYHNYQNPSANTSGNYATSGFDNDENYYYNSDRLIKLNSAMENITNNQVVQGYGLEIEQGNSKGLSSVALVMLNRNIIMSGLHEHLFKYQEDGSIDGIECITQVMSKAYIRNHYKDFYNAWQCMKLYGVTPNESCGMHINMSNNLFGSNSDQQAKNIAKMVHLINRFFEVFKVLYCRNNRSTYYCDLMSSWTNVSFAKNRGVELIKSDHSSNHYVCFNYAHFHEGRVELRLVGGAKSFRAFASMMELTFALVDYVKKASWDDIEKLNNDKLLNKLNANQMITKWFNAQLNTSIQPKNLDLNLDEIISSTTRSERW